MNNHFRSIFLTFMSIIALVLAVGCVSSKEEEDIPVNPSFKLMIIIPDTPFQVTAGESISLRFYDSKGPIKGDKVVLRNHGSEGIICPIISIGDGNFVFEVPSGLTSGLYTLCIKRGEEVKVAGKIEFEIEVCTEIDRKDGYNLYGLVTCDGVPVPDVLISDGENFVKTDENGVYYMQSSEHVRVVFAVQPSGYQFELDGAFPKMYRYLDGDPKSNDRTDFVLKKVDDENHIVYVVGDLHLAKRTKDLAQFAEFADDINARIRTNASYPQYIITLGDITWDRYWYENGFNLYSCKDIFNQYFSDIAIFNTVGNHDHDMKYAGDYDTIDAWKKIIGPSYYSFNVGNEHYVIIDNILCENTGKGDPDSRKYSNIISQDQLEWLKKDLSYVDKSKHVILTMHAPVYDENGKKAPSTETLESILDGYNVDIYTGHTHRAFNNNYKEGRNIYHHNSGAVCATWWWTGYYVHGNGICKDGTPAGYYEVKTRGGKYQWKYKAVGKDMNYQFRTYDGNKICLTADKYAPKAPSDKAKAFESFLSAGAWSRTDLSNKVYFNIWAYDPLWKIEVKENGKILPWTVEKKKDPLHLISYEAKRYNQGSDPTGDFKSYIIKDHLFSVTASSPTSTLEFKITDGFGNVYTETMRRPKDFSINIYN